jgi:hypothetical protein
VPVESFGNAPFEGSMRGEALNCLSGGIAVTRGV